MRNRVFAESLRTRTGEQGRWKIGRFRAVTPPLRAVCFYVYLMLSRTSQSQTHSSTVSRAVRSVLVRLKHSKVLSLQFLEG